MRDSIREILTAEVVDGNQAARELNIQPATIRQSIKRGGMEAVKLGGVWLLDRADINKLKQRKGHQ